MVPGVAYWGPITLRGGRGRGEVSIQPHLRENRELHKNSLPWVVVVVASAPLAPTYSKRSDGTHTHTHTHTHLQVWVGEEVQELREMPQHGAVSLSEEKPEALRGGLQE